MGGFDSARRRQGTAVVPLDRPPEDSPSKSLFPQDTWTISGLADEIKRSLKQRFWSVWVVGEVQRVSRSAAGHVYFELVEKGHQDRIKAKLDAALFRGQRPRVEKALRDAGQVLEAGQQLRCRGQIDFYAPGGKLSFIVREVDAVYSLGVLEKRRRENLAWLEAQGLLGKNAELPLGAAPRRIGLITAEGSAAYHDFLNTLELSGFHFEVVFADASVQGPTAERSMGVALERLLWAHEHRGALDALVLVRGGGARSDLAAFDGRKLAASVAQCPVPVLTGIGHETDESLVDLVAHTRLKTPTAVGELLVRRMQDAEAACEDLAAQILRAAQEQLTSQLRRLERARTVAMRCETRLERASARFLRLKEQLVRASRTRVAQERSRVHGIAGRFGVPSKRLIRRSEERVHRLGSALGTAGNRLVNQQGARVTSLARLIRQMSPERTLARGFSITRDENGRAVRNPSQVGAGVTISTILHQGEILSRVESVKADSAPDGPEGNA